MNCYDFHGDRLRELRQAMEITQRELASYVGVSYAMPSFWEAGGNNPSGENLKKMIDLFGVPMSFFTSEFRDEIPLAAFRRKDAVKRLCSEAYERRQIEERKAAGETTKDEKLLAVSRVLGVPAEVIENIEKSFSGIQKAVEYSRMINTQMTNLRQIQDQIDGYVSKVHEKSLELEELRKKLVELSEEVNGSGDLVILAKEAG